MYIVLELAEGGELFEKIIQKHKFNEKESGLKSWGKNLKIWENKITTKLF